MNRLLTIFFLITITSPIYPAYLFLTDGSIIKGTVVHESGTDVIFRGETDIKSKTYSSSMVLRVQYGDIIMERVLVKLKNGSEIRAFMVAEDSSSYTFRKDINKPDEFSVSRLDVLFVTQRYPTGLKGVAGSTYVDLKWDPSFEKMKSYNIYARKPEQKKPEKVASSGDNSYRLRGLDRHSKYFISVTGVDHSGTETIQSNVIEVDTINLKPSTPANVIITEEKPSVIKVAWQASEDPDGNVSKYTIHTVKGEKAVKAGETRDTWITLNMEPTDVERVHITAVDNLGEESVPADSRAFLPYSFNITLSTGILYPLSGFSSITSIGYGGTISFNLTNFIFKSFSAGLETGYYYLPGKNSIDEENIETRSSHLALGCLTLSYIFQPSANIILTPSAAAGSAYSHIEFSRLNKETDYYEDVKSDGFNPLVKLSLSADWSLSENLLAGISGAYGMILEPEGSMSFITCSINFGLRF
jgi:hypothetical protein